MKNRPRTRQYTACDASFTAKADAWQPAAKGFLGVFGRERTEALCALERERGFSADGRKVVFLTFENRFAQLGGLAAVMRFLPASMIKYGEDVTVVTPFYPNIPKMRDALACGLLEPVFVNEKMQLPETRGGCRQPAAVADGDNAVGSDGDDAVGSGRDEVVGSDGDDAVAAGNDVVADNADAAVCVYDSGDGEPREQGEPRELPETARASGPAVSCYRHVDSQVTSYFIGIDGRFTAESNPYSYVNNDDLLDDSLAFCAAVPRVLAKLGITADILFHAHDWETAPVAVTSKAAVLDGTLESARTVLTLHNSFDSGITVDRKKRYFGTDSRGATVVGDTVLQCAIPMLSGQLTTVSATFAAELRDDALQRTVFTNHLQEVFAANPPIGIENGMFGRPYLQYTHSALSRGRQGEFSQLLKEKAKFRERMLEIAGAMRHPGIIGELAGVDDGKPVLFMSGRLDIMQKGFDVIFQAIQKFAPGAVGLIFCPSSAEGVRHAREIAFFRDIAERRRGDIVIWPFRVSAEAYVSVVLGSSFLLMPSLYEPFGAATEGFMHGTPVVARATGGLTAQVRSEPAEEATGFLYRERGGGDGGGDHAQACREWREILGAPVGERIKVPLYRSMVDEAHGALKSAAETFADGQAYGRMMLNGMESLRGFSWDAAVWKYRRVYDSASRRGFFDK